MAEDLSHTLSPRRHTSAFFVHKRTKTMSPSKLDDNGGENIAPGSEVSPTASFYVSSIRGLYNPTKLLIFNVHGTLIESSLLIQPNPNPHIWVTKKTMTRRFVFRPWMMEFLRRCFKLFKVAFWKIKISEYMQEVLHEILPVFAHLEGHKPIFLWSAVEYNITSRTSKWK